MSKKILTVLATSIFALIAFASCESNPQQSQQQPKERLTVVCAEVTTVKTKVTTVTTEAVNNMVTFDDYIVETEQTTTAKTEATTTTEAVSYETTLVAQQNTNVKVEDNKYSNNNYYTVQSGDCMSLIAERLNCYEYELAIANPNLDWNYIQPGDQIVIPSGSSYTDYYNYSDYSEDNYEYYEDSWSYNSYQAQPEYLSGVTLYSAPDAASWNNIEVSMNYLNGLTLAPGEYFNWDSYIGWATVSNSMGYQDAPVLVGTDTGYATGGGVCVTSTALMQCARAAGMNIVEKHDHSRNVSYAQPGDEASVSYGEANLVFANTTGRTVTFYTSCSYGTVSVSCYAS